MVVDNTKDILLHGLLCCLLVTTTYASKCSVNVQLDANESSRYTNIENELKKFVDDALSKDNYEIVHGVNIERLVNLNNSLTEEQCKESGRSVVTSIDDYLWKKFENYARTHVVSIQIPETARFFKSGNDKLSSNQKSNQRITGKSSFLTGFGLGFLAFALKKLLLPMFIVGQIFKSVMIAMFLPSILGSLGKLAAKGISHASTLSGSSGHQQQAPIDDFDFKDTGAPYNVDGTHDEYAAVAAPEYNFQVQTAAATNNQNTNTATQQAMSRFGNEAYYQQKVAYVQPPSDNYYFRKPNKQHDYKVFHKIPSSSMLLTTYDPFYSPLLSRLDSVFVQLGLGDGKGPQIEKCRERLVCLMYANPAKYAPYSNLVSAQLSRELNELRKPSSDNPEIFRFFRYMRAAKDGQDGASCQTHSGCPSLQPDKPSPAMLTTFNDINKLVQARMLQ